MSSPKLNTALSLREDQTEFDPAQIATLNQALRVKHATREDLAVYFHQCRKTGLDPFAKQIYMIARQEWDPDMHAKVWRQTIQTGIDGFRLVARRAADRAKEVISYEDPIWFDRDGNEHKVWLDPDNPPYAAKAVVRRGKGRFPFIAHYSEYVPLKAEYAPDSVDAHGKKIKGEKTGRMLPSGMWGTRPAGQLYKCAEAGALRSACPQDLSGIYVHEEMERDQVIDVEPVTTVTTEHEPSGRDWLDELDKTQTGEDVNTLWNACRAAGERTAEFDKACRERGTWFRDNLVPDKPGQDVPPEGTPDTPEEPPADDGEWPEVAKPGGSPHGMV